MDVSSSLRWSKKTMYPLIEQYQASGQSQRDFCTTHQIKVCTFQYWLGKYRSDAQVDAPPSPGFVSLEIVDEPAAGYALEIREASGRQLCFRRLPAVSYLKELLC